MASVGQTEDRNGSNLSACGSGLPQVSQGEHGGTPHLGSTLRFSHQQENCLVSSGDNPEVMDDDDQTFLMNHIRKGTKELIKLGSASFKSSVRDMGYILSRLNCL